MKIAAQTIGLDLVAVKPTPGPKVDLLYIDFQYDDLDTEDARPQVFKLNNATKCCYQCINCICSYISITNTRWFTRW
jgi:hypothetical protein